MPSKTAFPLHVHSNGPAWCKSPTVIDDILQETQGKKPKRVRMSCQDGAPKDRRSSTISVVSKASTYDGYDYLDTLQRTDSGHGLYIRDTVTIRRKPLTKRLGAVLLRKGKIEPTVLHDQRGQEYGTYQRSTTRSGKAFVRTTVRAVLPKETADEIAILAAAGKDGIANKTGDEDADPDNIKENVPATRRVVRMHARRQHFFRRE